MNLPNPSPPVRLHDTQTTNCFHWQREKVARPSPFICLFAFKTTEEVATNLHQIFRVDKLWASLKTIRFLTPKTRAAGWHIFTPELTHAHIVWQFGKVTFLGAEGFQGSMLEDRMVLSLHAHLGSDDWSAVVESMHYITCSSSFY